MDQSVTWNVTGGLSFDHRSKILPPSAWDTTKFLPQRSFVQTTEGFWLLHFLSCETPLRNKRWWWFQIFLLCSPQSLGKWSNLIIFFQMGWFNHELGTVGEITHWSKPLLLSSWNILSVGLEGVFHGFFCMDVCYSQSWFSKETSWCDSRNLAEWMDLDRWKIWRFEKPFSGTKNIIFHWIIWGFTSGILIIRLHSLFLFYTISCVQVVKPQNQAFRLQMYVLLWVLVGTHPLDPPKHVLLLGANGRERWTELGVSKVSS